MLTPEIFVYLDKQEKDAGNEIQLTDAIQHLNQPPRVFPYEFEGDRYDEGEKLGVVKTTIELAMKCEELREDVLNYMQKNMKEKLSTKV